MKMLSLFLGLTISAQAWAWGGRGHHAVCEAAVHLVKSQELREYLKSKPHVMGFLCNVPDVYWKSLSSETRKIGDPGHFINVEKIGLKFSEVPNDYKKIVETYTGKPSKADESKTIYSVPDELGSSWWRADQFYRLALEAGKNIKTNPAPQNSKEEQNEELPYNKAFYQMMVNMGLMGHFVGDNGQPFHTSSDYDGYSAGHGGIHAYYEDSVVNEFGPDLVPRIVKKASTWKSQTFTSKDNVIDNMRALSELSYADLKEVYKNDPVITASSLKIEKGMSIKKQAVRKPASVAFKKMDEMIVKQMARSSLLLAHFWDEIYKASGSPAIKSYKSYQYPLMPDFVKPDYF